MMHYFTDVTTADEAKERYRTLVKQHHPDAGGDTTTMQAINAEWESISVRLFSAVNDGGASRPDCTAPQTVKIEQLNRMKAAIVKHAQEICSGARVYHR